MKWLATFLMITQLLSHIISFGSSGLPADLTANAVSTPATTQTPSPTIQPTPSQTPTPAPTEKPKKTAAPTATQKAKKKKTKKQKTTDASAAQTKTKSRTGISYTQEDVEELARIMLWEAGSESDKGQMAVAEVILNRVKHPSAWPNTIKGVIYQRSQFTPTNNPNYKKRAVSNHFRTLAKRVLDGESVLCCENVTYFSRGKSRYMADAFKIGRHWFGHRKHCAE